MSVNKVILIGNVGKDPDIRYLDNNVCVASFTLATTERGYTTSAGIQIPDKTEWHNIVLWRGLAKITEQYVKKGTQVYIEGKLRTRSWDDQNGIRRYTTEIYADNMELLGRRADQSNTISGNNYGPAQNTYPQPTSSGQSTSSNSFDENNQIDDLPF
ncbi:MULTISPECIES: single-stranded DNA-binding protein [Bacteroidales]|jgi:single-strand binding protein|uniref:single-stranded DNA-binding protein n=1 Tax=Bacteroidales TaxID=171549 RepID=UPI000575D568|nr:MULTISPECIES: single-stranded DNA-binding protein [Bacteroidales]KHM44214.1 single-stranded DNA-binding protein [Coprobacter secundus]